MTENRRFLTEDILVMISCDNRDDEIRRLEFLSTLSENGLLHLWQDLIRLTVAEDIS